MEKLNFESAVRLIREHCGDYSIQCCLDLRTKEEHFSLMLSHSDGKTYIYQILDAVEYERLLFYLLQPGSDYCAHLGTFKFRKNEYTDK